MNLTLTGLPALVVVVGVIVVFAAPVWLAARLTGAERPTLLRSIAALVVGALGSVVLAAVTGPLALLLCPLAYLLAFKWLLGTSFWGAVALALVAFAGYALLAHFAGAGADLAPAPVTRV